MRKYTKYIVLTLLVVFAGCDDKYYISNKNNKTFLDMERYQVVCNEFGLAYYRISNDRHTSYTPVYISPTEVAKCSELHLVKKK